MSVRATVPAAGTPERPPPAPGEQVGGLSLGAPMTAGAEIRVHRAHTEDGAVAALKLGFDVIHLERIVAFTLPHNQASRGAMEHCGFKYQRDFVHAGLPHVLYILEAREFAIGRLDSTS